MKKFILVIVILAALFFGYTYFMPQAQVQDTPVVTEEEAVEVYEENPEDTGGDLETIVSE